jgi:hypothetical protein
MLKRQHRRPKRPGDGQAGVGGPNAAFTPIIVEIPSGGGDNSDE